MRKIKLLKAALLSIIVISFTFSQENNLTDPADSLNVNKEDKKSLLLDDVKYDATDSIIINQKDNKISLYNNAKIIYGDIELTSGLIILDYKKNEVYAGRISDENGNLSQGQENTVSGLVNGNFLVSGLGDKLILKKNEDGKEECFGIKTWVNNTCYTKSYSRSDVLDLYRLDKADTKVDCSIVLGLDKDLKVTELFNEYRNKVHLLSNHLYNSYKNAYINKTTEKKGFFAKKSKRNSGNN